MWHNRISFGIRKVARWRSRQLIPVIIGVVLFGAGVLKAYRLAIDPSFATGLISSPWILFPLINFEIVFGAWLVIDRRHERVTRALGLLFLFGLASVSSSEAILGYAQCGCFGKLPISPSIAFILDIAGIIGLCAWGGSLTGPAYSWERPTLCVGVISAFFATAFLCGRYPSLLTADGVFDNGNGIILLRPEKWVDHTFPLLGYTNVDGKLAQGHWIVLLYREDCPICRKQLVKYERMAHEMAASGRTEVGVAFLRIPGEPERGVSTASRAASILHGSLVEGRQWVVATPLVVEIDDGLTKSLMSHDDISRYDNQSQLTQ